MIKKPEILLIILCATTTICAQIKVACIGNSITFGYGLSSPNTQSYPARLQELLGTHYSVQNDGVSSTTMLKNGDISYWKKGKLADVFSLKPDIITIKLGTNDTKPPNWDAHNQEFKKDYLSMIDTLTAIASKPKIYIVLPVPVMSNPKGASWGIRDSILQKIIPIIKEVASERNLTLIDANTPLLNFPHYFSVDGVHPNAAGEDTIAHVLYRSIVATSVIPTQPAILQRNRDAFNSVYPVFNGCTMTRLFAAIKPGCRYDLQVFTTGGALITRRSAYATPATRAFLTTLCTATPAVRWVVLRIHPTDNVPSNSGSRFRR